MDYCNICFKKKGVFLEFNLELFLIMISFICI